MDTFSEVDLIHYDYETEALIALLLVIVLMFYFIMHKRPFVPYTPPSSPIMDTNLETYIEHKKDLLTDHTLDFDETKFEIFEEWLDNQSAMPSPDDVLVPSLIYSSKSVEDESNDPGCFIASSFEDILRKQLVSRDQLKIEKKDKKGKTLIPKVKLFDIEVANSDFSSKLQKLKKTIEEPLFNKFKKTLNHEAAATAFKQKEDTNFDRKFSLSSLKSSFTEPSPESSSKKKDLDVNI